MEIKFNGKTALVSGAGKGIGNAIAKKLVACGAQVIALDINRGDLERLKEEVPSVRIILVNLSDWFETKRLLEDVDKIDLLVNNAGVAKLNALLDITEDHIDELFSINFKPVVNLTQFVVQNLRNRNVSGSIVNISSQASVRGMKDHGIYSATKGAVDSFTKVMALELGEHNIRVNCVNPTVVLTELGRKIWSEPKACGAMTAKIPLKRFAEVGEVVDAVLFLLSENASMITGSCLPVDGGVLSAL